VYRLPSNFPPTNTATRQLAGLGAPDLRGTYGEYSFFTDDPKAAAVAGDAATRVEFANGCVHTKLIGPADTLRANEPPAAVDFTIYVDAARGLAKLAFPGQEVLLKPGEWSEWVVVSFEMLPHLARASGICRFYLKQVAPHFQLYATPVNVDPMDPALPICAPADFAKQLAQKHGRFYTQGFPEDVKALRSGVLDDGEYLQQAGQCLEEERRMYTSALHDFSRGLLCYYFSATDRTQHMFWRTSDPRHPAYTAEAAREYGPAIDDCYRMADALVGEAMEAADDDTTLIVMSDHGFAPYYRSFNLNGWLAQEGHLQGVAPWSKEQDLFANADWARTQAYAVGFNALYLNLQDREVDGVVSRSDRDDLLARLKAQLLAVTDPETGGRVFAGVYDRSDYRGEIADRAPDLILGYVPGYRVSDSSVLGGVAGKLVEDNLDKWSGDHCIDRLHVPGMLLSNRPARLETPGLPDVTATLLAEFGAQQPAEMIGEPAV
jgi:predicted AlkP superfamily phosphohydrolase/phosphomutase